MQKKITGTLEDNEIRTKTNCKITLISGYFISKLFIPLKHFN